MLNMKTRETQAHNDDRAEAIRTKVLEKIEAQLAQRELQPDELTRLLEALRPAPLR